MTKNICLFVFFEAISLVSKAKEADTLLNKVSSNPYAYNIVQNEQGDIYMGTATGIYQVSGEEIRQIDTRSGYVKVGKSGAPDIDSVGISNHESYRYLHLLPYPEEKRQVHHSGTSTHFYLVSGGRLYIFDIAPYSISHRNQSIRSISRNLTGGYSGVFYKGEKLDFPLFTDGYIREFGDTAFICYGGLYLITPGGHQNFLSEAPYGGYLDSLYIGYVDDIYFDGPHGVYFLATSTGVFMADRNLRNIRKILSVRKEDPVVLIGSKESFMFTAGRKVYAVSFDSKQISEEEEVSEPILSGVKLSNRVIYMLSSGTLYKSTTSRYGQPISNFKDVHTLLLLNEKELIIAGNQGLFLFNTETTKTSPIIRGVEFNKRALYADQERLYAGSINGLYTIDLKQLHRLVELNQQKDVPAEGVAWNWVGLALLLIAGFSGIIYRLKRKLKNAEQIISETRIQSESLPEKKLDREKIVAYIRENLTTASIKSINEHFQSNTNQIYAILEPDKPGTIIQQLRMELVIDMKKRGNGLADIAAATGFSQSYIKKIKMNASSLKDISDD